MFYYWQQWVGFISIYISVLVPFNLWEKGNY